MDVFATYVFSKTELDHLVRTSGKIPSVAGSERALQNILQKSSSSQPMMVGADVMHVRKQPETSEVLIFLNNGCTHLGPIYRPMFHLNHFCQFFCYSFVNSYQPFLSTSPICINSEVDNFVKKRYFTILPMSAIFKNTLK